MQIELSQEAVQFLHGMISNLSIQAKTPNLVQTAQTLEEIKVALATALVGTEAESEDTNAAE